MATTITTAKLSGASPSPMLSVELHRRIVKGPFCLSTPTAVHCDLRVSGSRHNDKLATVGKGLLNHALLTQGLFSIFISISLLFVHVCVSSRLLVWAKAGLFTASLLYYCRCCLLVNLCVLVAMKILVTVSNGPGPHALQLDKTSPLYAFHLQRRPGMLLNTDSE